MSLFSFFCDTFVGGHFTQELLLRLEREQYLDSLNEKGAEEEARERSSSIKEWT